MQKVRGSTPLAPISSFNEMDKEQLIKLYKTKKLSMTEIASELKTTEAKVYYWLKKYDIQRRKQSESAYAKQNRNGDPFKIKKNLTQKEKGLLLTGLMLYWAEGTKKNRFLVSLGNLDSRMIKLFLEFLRKICRVDEGRIKLYVRLYKDFNKEEAQSYWANCLNIPKSQVHVYSHIDVRSNPKKQWSKNGIASLQFASTKLKQWIDNTVEDYLSKAIKA